MTAALIAADPPTVPPSDGKPPGQPYVSPDDLASIGPLWDDAARQHLDPLVAEIWQDSSDTIHAEMIDVTGVPSLPNVSSLAGEQYLQQAVNTFDEVGDELWGVARSELLAGFEAGESIEQLADRLRHSAGLTAKKATLVARTQIIEANNAASIATARAADLDMQKEWMSAEDRRVRPAHAEANGQRVDLNDKFLVGGYQADYPGDPVLSPALRYSCRCTVGYVMPDEAVEKAHRQAELPLELPNTSGAEPVPTAPAPLVVQPEPSRAEKRAAARARQKEIATADGNARLLAEVDELAAKKATKKTIRSRLDPTLIEPDQLFANADPALLDQLREAVTSTAVARLQTVVARIATERGLVPIGKAGAQLRFDPATMRTLADVDIPDGELVDVVRQGHIFGTGSDAVQLDQAVVTRATTGEQIQALQDRLSALQDLLDSGETTDEDGGDLEAAIAQVQAALAAFPAKPLLSPVEVGINRVRGVLSAAPKGLNRRPTGLTASQRAALRDYQGVMYYGINGQLRASELGGSHARRVRQIDSALADSRLTRDIDVWRGVADGRTFFGSRLDHDLTGMAWQELAFMSTSAAERVALDFTYPGVGEFPVLIRLSVPNGIGAVQISGAGSQAEVLLERGLSLRVTADHGISPRGYRLLDVTVERLETSAQKGGAK